MMKIHMYKEHYVKKQETQFSIVKKLSKLSEGGSLVLHYVTSHICLAWSLLRPSVGLGHVRESVSGCRDRVKMRPGVLCPVSWADLLQSIPSPGSWFLECLG